MNNILKRFTKSITIKNKILIYLVIFTMLPTVIIAMYSYFTIKKSALTNHLSVIEKNLQKCSYLINMEYNSYIQKGTYILSNSYLNANLNKTFENDIDDAILFNNNINVLFKSFECYEPYNKNPFSIYSSNTNLDFNRYILDIETIESRKQMKKLQDMPMSTVLWDVKSNKSYNNIDIFYYRRLNLDKKTEAILKCKIPFDKIDYYIKQIAMPENGIVTYFNNNGELKYINSSLHNINTDNIESKNNNKFFVLSHKLNNNDELCILIPKNFLFSYNLKVLAVIFLISIGVFYITIIVSKFTTKNITKGLDEFISAIQKNDNNILTRKFKNINSDEINFVKQRFIDSINQINALNRKSIEYNNQINSLELELMQSRINPHLLYNSLSVIKWSVIEKKDYKSADLIDTMTRYYRLALNKGNNNIPIKDEIRMIKEYVKINETSRFSNYNLKINIEENILDCFIIKHLLQPIVENSILHAYDLYETNEKIISISGFSDKNFIVFEIKDNGVGMEQTKIDDLMNFDYVSNYGGYGIKNTIKRLKMHYGKESFLKIDSKINVGTKVTIKINKIINNKN